MLASTHGLPLELVLGRLSQEVENLELVGIQPGELGWGEGLSPQVAAGAQRLVELLLSGRWRDIPLCRLPPRPG